MAKKKYDDETRVRIIRGAVKLMKRGWTEEIATDADGWTINAWDERAANFCAVGAIYRAALDERLVNKKDNQYAYRFAEEIVQNEYPKGCEALHSLNDGYYYYDEDTGVEYEGGGFNDVVTFLRKRANKIARDLRKAAA